MTNTVRYLLLDSHKGNHVVGKAEDFEDIRKQWHTLLKQHPNQPYRWTVRPRGPR